MTEPKSVVLPITPRGIGGAVELPGDEAKFSSRMRVAKEEIVRILAG